MGVGGGDSLALPLRGLHNRFLLGPVSSTHGEPSAGMEAGLDEGQLSQGALLSSPPPRFCMLA